MLIVVFLALWLIFNSRFTWEVALFGLAISAWLSMFVRRYVLTDWSLRRELNIIRRIPACLRYGGLLLKEIALANMQVLHFIYSPRQEVQPKLASFKTKLSTRGARVMLADSITLTPGTITVSLHDDTYLVHCLDESMEDGLYDSSFEKHLHEIESIGQRKESDHA